MNKPTTNNLSPGNILFPVSSQSVRSRLRLDDFVEAFESAWNVGREPELSAFLPNDDHPEYLAIAQELLCIDLERRWQLGQQTALENYVSRYPKLMAHESTLEQLAFEDYRLRSQYGVSLDPATYQATWGIDVRHWPRHAATSDRSGEVRAEETTRNQVGNRSTTPIGSHPYGQSPWTMPQVGESFLGFDLIELLGEGKIGKVFLGKQLDLAGRHVALKVSHDLWAESDRLAKLQHSNIVPIYSVHQTETMQAVCMPFLGRKTLHDWLQSYPTDSQTGVRTADGKAYSNFAVASAGRDGQETRSAEEMSLWIVSKIAAGLAHAHRRGIVHRDLKPANILLADDGEPMILDFNLSQEMETRSPEIVGGTLPYMAPEHLRAAVSGGPTTPACDIYSLGVILYQLLTGRLPYPVRSGSLEYNLTQLIADRERAASLDDLPKSISPSTRSILLRALAPDPNSRYARVEAFQEDLERQLKQLPLRFATEPSWAIRVRKWIRRNPPMVTIGIVVGTAGLLLALATGALVQRNRVVGRLAAEQTLQSFLQQSDAALPLLSTPVADSQIYEQAKTTAQLAIDKYPQQGTDQTLVYLPSAEQQTVRERLGELHFLLADSQRREAALLEESARREQLMQAAQQSHYDATRWLAGGAGKSLLTQKSKIEQALGHLEPAEVLRQQAETLASPHRLDRYLLATQQLTNGEYGSARVLLEELRQESPRNYQIWFMLGRSHEELGGAREAETCYTYCIALQPITYLAPFHRGIARLDQEAFALAVQDFTESLRLLPQHGAALANRAIAREGLGELQGAVDDLTQAIDAGNPDPRYLLLRSRIWKKIGDSSAADRDLQEALQREPRDAAGWLARGLAQVETNPDKALADLEQALRRHPNSRRVLKNMAYLLGEQLGRVDEAIEMLNRMLTLNPNDAEALLGRGVFQARQEKDELAKQDAQDALSIDKTPQFCYQAACIYALTCPRNGEDEQKAIRLLKEAIRGKLDWAKIAVRDPDLLAISKSESFRRVVSAAGTILSDRADTP